MNKGLPWEWICSTPFSPLILLFNNKITQKDDVTAQSQPKKQKQKQKFFIFFNSDQLENHRKTLNL